MEHKYRFAFDTGGTFTDLVLFCEDTGEAWIGKVPSTPDRPAQAVIQGFDRLIKNAGVEPARSDVQVFGATTIVANRLIERKGARTALITTRGFRDVLEIGREIRYDLYDLQLEFLSPLVPRELRFEVQERLDRNGSVFKHLDRDEVKGIAKKLATQNIESLAICFLHSYQNPQHEKDAARLISHELPDIALTLSSELVREIREYERTSTTVANAYVKPVMKRHVGELRIELAARGVASEPYFMLSSGSIISADLAEEYPIRLAESGPAAGVLVAAFLGRQVGRHDLLSFDMGGTTAKIGLISDGRPAMATEFEVARAHRFKKRSGLPIKVPVIEIIEIGAGGGSIACIDNLELLKVGPESAEARPGPSCYKLGGLNPTVTDANLVLGYLNPLFFLGGEMVLDVERAKRAITTMVAERLGVDTVTAAAGIYDVVNENMIKAAKMHIAEKAKDPRTLTLMAFGGGGPIHARKIAKALGINTVLIPPRAGVSSAVGLLVAPVAMDAVRSYVTRLDEDTDWVHLNKVYQDMWEETSAILNQAQAGNEELRVERSVDMRYVGQGYEINVPLELEAFGPGAVAQIEQAFYRVYEHLYGRHIADMPIEAVNWRMLVSGPQPDLEIRTLIEGSASPGSSVKGRREVFFSEVMDFVDVVVYDRQWLCTGDLIAGPAVVEEIESTTVIGPGEELTVDECLNLVIKL